MTQSEIQSLRPSQIVQFMIDGLRAQHVTVVMSVFGLFDPDTKTCFGCAATNAMCQMTGARFTGPEINTDGRANAYNLEHYFAYTLETVYDNLRRGFVNIANDRLLDIGMPQLPPPQTELPPLHTHNYLVHLPAYQAYADYCRSLESTVTTTDL